MLETDVSYDERSKCRTVLSNDVLAGSLCLESPVIERDEVTISQDGAGT